MKVIFLLIGVSLFSLEGLAENSRRRNRSQRPASVNQNFPGLSPTQMQLVSVSTKDRLNNKNKRKGASRYGKRGTAAKRQSAKPLLPENRAAQARAALVAEARINHQMARNPERISWINQLQSDDPSEKISIMKNWRDFLQSPDDRIAFSHLQNRLSDKEPNVRKVAITVLGEIAEVIPRLATEVIGALVKPRPNDSETLILEKMQLAKEIFFKPSYDVHFSKARDRLDKIDAVYRIAESGFSEWSTKAQLIIIDIVNTAIDELVEDAEGKIRSATSRYQEENATKALDSYIKDLVDFNFKGMQIVVKGLNNESSELRLAVRKFLKRWSERHILPSDKQSDKQIFQIILPEIRKGILSSNRDIRKEFSEFLIEIVEPDPSLNPEITFLLTQFQQEGKHNPEIKMAIKTTLIQLARIQDNSSSSCEDLWTVEEGKK